MGGLEGPPKLDAREITILVCVVLAVVAAVVARGSSPADGPLLDVLVKARSIFSSTSPTPESAAVAVIAIDQRSLDEPELAAYPRTFLAPAWARMIDTVLGAGAKAVGFDIVFAYSANRFAPDFDEPFLAALGRHRERIVLARSASAFPAPPFVAALRADPGALGLGDLGADRDGTYRRVRAAYHTVEGDVVPGLAAAVLRRGGQTQMPETVVVAPPHHLEALPTYALIDVLRCARTPAALSRAFAGKFVLVGTTLPDEDRRAPAGRFLSPPTQDAAPIDACGLRRLAASNPEAASVPGVFIHAAAIDAVARDRLLVTGGTTLVAGLSALTGGLGAVAGFTLSPWLALAGVVLVAAVLLVGATVALASSVWVPIALPLQALIVAPVLAYIVRYVVEERVRRRIEHAFSHYLAPAVVERLSRDATALRLGGELREVTIMFADLSGFTALSGRVSAEVLTRVTNQYLAYIVDAVEATGGYVDKFIGDAVMAMWGAPASDPAHATNAVRAALAAAARIRAEREEADRQGQPGYGVKIGLNSGPAVVGNVGTEKRYNYTAIGETVNVASRLESVPGIYACDIVCGPRTFELAAQDFCWVELDWLRVKGRDAPLALHAPLASQDAATAAHLSSRERFGAALAQYRAMRFAEAAATWEKLTTEADDAVSTHGPATVMSVRARTFALKPPSEPWDGVWVLTSK